jgi:serine/threonine-protein kinase PknK
VSVARRVVIADDDILVREGVASILGTAGYEVVDQAQDAMTLPDVVRQHVPALVVLDIRMPPTHTLEGLDAARLIRSEFPEIGILLLSAHVEIETAIDLLQEGTGIGYLLKTRLFRQADLIDALERIIAGGCVIDPALVRELVTSRHHVDDPLTRLTPREREVLALMAEGSSNSGIGAHLQISEGAVEKNVRSILAKLDLPVSESSHRRVLAVLTYLGAR